MPAIRLAIADDHKIFRKGLVATLSDYPLVKLVLEAGNGKELVEQLPACLPDVVLMDLKMPLMDGLEATAHVRHHHSRIKVLALSMFDDDRYLISMMKAGARGYLLKNAEPDEIVRAIREVSEKEFYFNDQLSVAMLHKVLGNEALPNTSSGQVALTSREIEVLRLVCQEYTNLEIADRLCVSARTVEGYRTQLFEKINARNIAGLVLYAIRHRIIDV